MKRAVTRFVTKKKLVLVDGHAIIHRAYHAIPVLTNRSGQQTNAVYGFVSMLLRVVNDLKPTWLAVAFDLPVPTFRHVAYIAYQAHRPSVDQELKDQIELVKEVLEAAGVPIYSSPSFEADDVIGTLARQAVGREGKGERGKGKGKVDEVVIVTGDRDIMQLVNDRKAVRVYAPVRGLSESQMFDGKAVEEYVGVKPEQIIDYKALVGDASDNYPGVPGIGPKTAVALLRKYGGLEEIYRRLETFPAAVADKLKDGHEGARLSKKLATIICDVPVELDLKRAKVCNLNQNEEFIKKLGELGFRSLIARLRPAPDGAGLRRGDAHAGSGKLRNDQLGLLDNSS